MTEDIIEKDFPQVSSNLMGGLIKEKEISVFQGEFVGMINNVDNKGVKAGVGAFSGSVKYIFKIFVLVAFFEWINDFAAKVREHNLIDKK